MFEADSQNFASVPRQFQLKKNFGPPSAGPIGGTLGGGWVPANAPPPPPLQTPSPPPSNPSPGPGPRCSDPPGRSQGPTSNAAPQTTRAVPLRCGRPPQRPHLSRGGAVAPGSFVAGCSRTAPHSEAEMTVAGTPSPFDRVQMKAMPAASHERGVWVKTIKRPNAGCAMVTPFAAWKLGCP